MEKRRYKLTPWRKALHGGLFAVIAATWSVALVNVASDKGWEPFRTIAYRGRIHHHYRDNAPDKLADVGSLLRKNYGQEDRLLNRLENKYSSPIPDLDVGSLGIAAFYHTLDVASDLVPVEVADVAASKWRQWTELPLQQQLVIITAHAVALSTGCLGLFPLLSPASEEQAPVFIASWTALAAASLHPFPQFRNFSASKLASSMRKWWQSLEAPREQLWVVTTAAAAATAVRPKGQRRAVLLVWAAACLCLTNPGAGAPGAEGTIENDSGARFQKAALAAVATSSGTSLTSLSKSFPAGSLAVTDLGLASLLTFSKQGNHHWLSPAIAIGFAGHWRGTVEVKPQAGGVVMSGRPAPAWVIPTALASVGWAAAQIPF